MVYIIDSYAWVEYFLGSAKGEILRKLFSGEKNKFLTVECCLAEIRGWSLRNNQDFDNLFTVIRANSKIIPVTEHDWINAAEIKFEQQRRSPDFGLIDAVILVKQKEFGCEIISGDKHFKGLKKVVLLF
ncbi:MAG: PIN domain-containing protein [Nanoarchaeota archaeon]